MAVQVCALIGRLGVASVSRENRVVLISEVIMALTSPAKGKEMSSVNLT